jgi:hypothetical protein
MSTVSAPRKRLAGAGNGDKAPSPKLRARPGTICGSVPVELATRPDAIAVTPWAQLYARFLALTSSTSFILSVWSWRLQTQSLASLGSSGSLPIWKLWVAWFVINLEVLVARESILLVNPQKGAGKECTCHFEFAHPMPSPNPCDRDSSKQYTVWQMAPTVASSWR